MIAINVCDDGTARTIKAQYYKNSAARHWCLRYARSEEMKARRRLVGDNGGIKFQGKIAMVRDDRCVNTITNVLKDNLILESYE